MRSLLYAITVTVPTKPGKVNQRKTLPSRSLVWVGKVCSKITVKQGGEC